MGQQSLIYAFVARGTVILAEYTEFTGNFPAIAAQCLQRLPAGSSSASTGPDGRGGAPVRFSYACDGHTFNFLLHRGYGEKDAINRCLLSLLLLHH